MQTAMQHPDAERLAAFDHVLPTPEEQAHLASCAACRAELEAYAALAGMAHEAGHRSYADAPRLTNWESLSASLRSEGLLTSTADITPMRTPAVVLQLAPPHTNAPSTSRRRAGWTTASWARAAAAVTLMAASAFAGRLSAGWNAGNAAVDGASSAPTATVAQQVLADRDPYASVEDATAALSRAQGEYERASLWLAGRDTTTRSSEVYRARLAALDQMMAASQAALRDAPQDPVLNHYFLAAYTAREATLQQLGGALPVDKTIESY